MSHIFGELLMNPMQINAWKYKCQYLRLLTALLVLNCKKKNEKYKIMYICLSNIMMAGNIPFPCSIFGICAKFYSNVTANLYPHRGGINGLKQRSANIKENCKCLDSLSKHTLAC